jgi:hypothetical protein
MAAVAVLRVKAWRPWPCWEWRHGGRGCAESEGMAAVLSKWARRTFPHWGRVARAMWAWRPWPCWAYGPGGRGRGERKDRLKLLLGIQKIFFFWGVENLWYDREIGFSLHYSKSGWKLNGHFLPNYYRLNFKYIHFQVPLIIFSKNVFQWIHWQILKSIINEV